MDLRKRQELFVTRALKHLEIYGETLGVAPTGAGKTIMMSAVIKKQLEKGARKVLVLQHRDRLVEQNESRFKMFAKTSAYSTSFFNSKEKDWSGKIVFGMVQTLKNDKNLQSLPTFDLIVIDETHHAEAESYKKIILAAKKLNPSLYILGVTATPARGDKKRLSIFTNICDQIFFDELVAEGLLVPPRAEIVDVGVTQKLAALQVKKLTKDYDQEEVSDILNTHEIAEKVGQLFVTEDCGKTVIFCSNVQHVLLLSSCLDKAGIKHRSIIGSTPAKDRVKIYDEFEHGSLDLLLNVFVLTEGWDCPACRTVFLLKKSALEGTITQMLGRAARPFEGKTHFKVFDFGQSLETKGFKTSFSDSGLYEVEDPHGDQKARETETPEPYVCPKCEMCLPEKWKFCPVCTCDMEAVAQEMKRRQIVLDAKPDAFRWSNFFGKNVYLASGLASAAMIFFREDEEIWELMTLSKRTAKLPVKASFEICLGIAEKFLFEKETTKVAEESSEWMLQDPSKAQLRYIKRTETFGMTKYDASCLLSLQFRSGCIARLENFYVSDLVKGILNG